MGNWFRVLLSLLILLALLLLASCGSSLGCGPVSFGGTCSSSSGGSGSFSGGGGTGGGGGGGGGGGTPTAFVYAVDENGSMDAYTFSATAGTLLPTSGYTAPTIPTNQGGVGVVVAQGKFLYAVFQDLQEIYGWSISATGSLTQLSGFPISVPIGNISTLDYNQQVVITNPAGTLLFISEFIPEEIFVYQISSSGALTAAPGSPVSTLPATLEPQNMAMDGLGRFLYVSEDSGDHSGAFVVGYSVGTTGTLTEIPNSFVWGNIPIWEMQGEPSGQYMIGITGQSAYFYGTDDDHIHVYSVNQTSGVLSEVSGSPFLTTYAPFNITVQPTSTNGEFVYSFGINDSFLGFNPIEGFQLNTTTGALTELSTSPFSNLTSAPWGQFDQSGNYLFLYSTSGSTANLNVLDTDSSGGLSESVGTEALTTGGYWAPVDVP